MILLLAFINTVLELCNALILTNFTKYCFLIEDCYNMKSGLVSAVIQMRDIGTIYSL